MRISYDLKERCVEASNTMSNREIYDTIFVAEHDTMSFRTFKRKLYSWKKMCFAESETLKSGTFPDFVAHSATVQVNKNGDITQAWIKQSSNDNDIKLILEAISENIEAVNIQREMKHCDVAMLEIPYFDMHFGIATFDNYQKILNNTLDIIESKHWQEVNILLGQDLIHTNDMRGHTVKGTNIQCIDVKRAWKDAWLFWCTVIGLALANSEKVFVRYSKGNHDECISWCFLKALEARYPQVVFDDAFKSRKCFVWNGCFIGYGHCEYTRSLDKLFRDFVNDYSLEYSQCKAREIHTGHLHSEGTDNGFVVRRLSSAVPVDEWSDDNGFIGSHKRFQLFEWNTGALKAIYYIK